VGLQLFVDDVGHCVSGGLDNHQNITLKKYLKDLPGLYTLRYNIYIPSSFTPAAGYGHSTPNTKSGKLFTMLCPTRKPKSQSSCKKFLVLPPPFLVFVFGTFVGLQLSVDGRRGLRIWRTRQSPKYHV